ncbi:hypothetical protein HNY42_03040 [Exiguobacterium sp. Helios]|uniref:hypothetical protein n=1 Tax=Exiguobacterium sp. Helios TaxID=2735868 RepID=UPI00165E2731|nr:hypothetical protein [Exiguobacterium sp. Helios]QNR19962.1 hypothetical protein HNY42_03040 [Exiguobacterium sp. Helios]
MEQTKQDDKLYQQALSSLRQLNEEIFLNDLQKMMGLATDELKYEVHEMMDGMKKQHGQLSAILQNNGKKSLESLGQSNEKIQELFETMNAYSDEFERSLKVTLEEMKNDSSEKMMKYSEHSSRQLERYRDISKSWEEQWIIWTEEHEDRLSRMDTLKSEIRIMNEDWKKATEKFTEELDVNKQMNESNITVLSRCLLDVRDATEGFITLFEASLNRMELRHQQQMELQRNDLEQSMESQKPALNSLAKEMDEKVVQMNQLIHNFQERLDERTEQQERFRQTHIENLFEGQRQLSETVEENLHAENKKFESKYDTQNKQNRLFFGGIIILSIIQIVLHFV